MTPSEDTDADRLAWAASADDWLEARHERGPRAEHIIVGARKRLPRASVPDWEWFGDALGDQRHKWFVAALFRIHPVPKRLRRKMLEAGVLERDPSFNRYFVEPCVRSFGAKWVLEQLLQYLREGGNADKAGAANASYWVYENPLNEELETISAEFQEAALKEFITSENLDVRRCLIAKLDLQPAKATQAGRSLVEEAIAIARTHEDEYIRHRVAVQLGAGGPFMALQRHISE